MNRPTLLLVLALFARCSRSEPADDGAPRPTAAHSVSSAAQTLDEPPAGSVDLIRELPKCDIDHQGVFLDLGTPEMDARRDHTVGTSEDAPAYERAGATFARYHTKRAAYEFALVEPSRGVAVTMRALGGASRFANVYLDERRAGIVSLSRDEPTIVSTPPLDELGVGLHTVMVRFVGSAQGADDAYGELDWIRIGPPDPAPKSYAPPTLADIVTDVVLDGEPRRSIVLRSPSTVRCAVRIADGMKLKVGVGHWGSGHGTASIRIIEDGEKPNVVAEHKVTGGAGAAWTPVTVDLAPYASHVVGVELSASESDGGGRVAFGEPSLVGPKTATEPPPSAQLAVVVVLSGLDRRMVPPWGPVEGFPGIGKLARDGVTFDRYRAPTTVTSAVMASLLTGLSPTAHGLETSTARLADDVDLLSERAKEGSASAAFFTGVPMSFPAFGFDRGWDRVEDFSPVKDVPATEPIARSTAWIREAVSAGRASKLLVVAHARGGHPPWDVTKDEVAGLPPDEYSGPIEPRAGAIVLANLRASRNPVDQRLSGGDWRRLRALEETALKKHDAELKRLIDMLGRENLYDRALIVVMGDVATGDPPGVPFAPSPPLREDLLITPLIVKFPKSALAGVRVSAMATTVDVTATLVHALGLDGDVPGAVDLFKIAKNQLPLDGRPLVATLGPRYATRFGPWLLSGDIGRRPSLCLVDVDPACSTDAYATSPLAASALWRRTFDFELAARAARTHSSQKPASVVLDADTEAALRVFGY